MKNNFLLFLAITLMALFVRLEYNRATFVDHPIRGDAKSYVIYGYNLFEHGTFSKTPSATPEPDSFWSPGFPLIIALAMAAGGPEGGYYPVILYIQALIGALLVPLLFLIGKNVMPRWAIISAALLTAFSPHLISIGNYLLSETLFSFFLLASVVSFHKAVKKRNGFFFALSGTLFGYSYLINPIIFFLPWILVLLTILQENRESRPMFYNPYIKKPIIFLVVFCLFSGGWGIRNAITLQSKSDSSRERALMNLVQGSQPEFFEDWRAGRHQQKDSPVHREFFASKKSFSAFAEIFYSRFRENPTKYLTWYLLKKPYLLWSWNIQIGQGDIYIYPTPWSLYSVSRTANMTKQIMRVVHPVILLLMLSGLYMAALKIIRKETGLIDIPVILFTTVLYVTVIYVVFQSEPRYSIPLRPELYLVAMWSLSMWIKSAFNKKNK